MTSNLKLKYDKANASLDFSLSIKKSGHKDFVPHEKTVEITDSNTKDVILQC